MYSYHFDTENDVTAANTTKEKHICDVCGDVGSLKPIGLRLCEAHRKNVEGMMDPNNPDYEMSKPNLDKWLNVLPKLEKTNTIASAVKNSLLRQNAWRAGTNSVAGF